MGRMLPPKIKNVTWNPNCHSIGSFQCFPLKGDPLAVFAIGGSAGGFLFLLVTNELIKSDSIRSLVKACVSLCSATWHPDNVPQEYAADFTSYIGFAQDASSIDGESI